MYLLYSVHPKTLNITHRGGCLSYDDATQALQKQVQDYLTIYKGQKNLVYVNNKQEIRDGSNKYCLKISNKFPNKISVYERKETTNKGYVYNSVNVEIEKIMVFSFMEISIPKEASTSESEQVTQLNTVQYTNSIQSQKSTQMSHGTHVRYISELREVLNQKFGNRDEE